MWWCIAVALAGRLQIGVSEVREGATTTIDVHGIPGHQVFLLGGLASGRHCVTGRCVPIRPDRLLATESLDPLGQATITLPTPALPPGTDLHFVAVYFNPWDVSPPVTRELLAATETDCRDGIDNDQDGLVDCEDVDCMGACTEADCGDGLDDDVDGLTDCRDEDCWAPTGPCTIDVSLTGGTASHHLTVALPEDCARSTVFMDRVGIAQVENAEGMFTFRGPSGTSSCSWEASLMRAEGRSPTYIWYTQSPQLYPSGVFNRRISLDTPTFVGSWTPPGCPPVAALFDGRPLHLDREEIALGNRAWLHGVYDNMQTLQRRGQCVHVYYSLGYPQYFQFTESYVAQETFYTHPTLSNQPVQLRP